MIDAVRPCDKEAIISDAGEQADAQAGPAAPSTPNPVSPRQWPFHLCCIVVALIFTVPYLAGESIDFAMEDESIWHGELWRLVLCAFVHADVIHLIFNLYWIVEFGKPIEVRFGSARAALLFLLLCLGSGAPEFLIADGGIGLSGVVYGYFGFLFALRGRDPIGNELDRRTVVLFIGWFLLCVWLSIAEVWAIGNIAHGAGALLGFLTGRAIVARARRKWVAGIAALALSVTGATLYMPWDFVWWWDRAATQFDDGDFGAARASYSRALKLAPVEAHSDIMVDLAVLAEYSDDLPTAVLWYKRAEETADKPGHVRAYLAHAYFWFDEEGQAARIVRELTPDDLDDFLRGEDDFMAFFRSIHDSPKE